MKKLLIALIILSTISTGAWSQQGRPMGRMNDAKMERIHAARMAYITDRLHLTEEQSSRFIPLYNEYDQEIRNTRVFFFKKYKGISPDQADDGTAKQAVDDNLDYQQQVIDIKRKYNERFLRVISPQQLSDLNKAEREFRQILMQRLRQRNGGGGGNGRFNRGNGNGY
jgi:hypothetical protein